MDRQIHVSIIGNCVVRDAFGFKEDEATDQSDLGYIVDRYAQKQNPVSAVDGGRILVDGKTVKESGILNMDRFSTLHNFMKRNFEIDIERNMFDYIAECKSEYLILDMIGCRCGLFKFKNGDKYIYSSDNYTWYQSAVDALKKLGYINMDYELVNSEEEMVPLLKSRIHDYFDRILEIYPVDRIILVEYKPIDFYLQNNVIKIFKNTKGVKKHHKWAEMAFSIAEERLKGCHIIRFPENVLCDKNHKWGLATSHYTREYYDYLYNAYDVIMRENNDPETERKKLEQLKDQCSMLYYKKYGALMYESLKKFQTKAEIADTYKIYCEYYEKLISKTNAAEIAVQFMKKHGYKSCAFLGYNKTTKLFIKVLRKNRIKVDYILENSNKSEIDGIPIYRRVTFDLPKTDVIIFSIFSPDADILKQKYEAMTDIPIADICDFLS